MVSPGGLSFIGNSVEATPGRVLSVPRGLLHEMLANAARRAGAAAQAWWFRFFFLKVLFFFVFFAKFDQGVNVVDGCTVRRCVQAGLWEIHCSLDDGAS